MGMPCNSDQAENNLDFASLEGHSFLGCLDSSTSSGGWWLDQRFYLILDKEACYSDLVAKGPDLFPMDRGLSFSGSFSCLIWELMVRLEVSLGFSNSISMCWGALVKLLLVSYGGGLDLPFDFISPCLRASGSLGLVPGWCFSARTFPLGMDFPFVDFKKSPFFIQTKEDGPLYKYWINFDIMHQTIFEWLILSARLWPQL